MNVQMKCAFNIQHCALNMVMLYPSAAPRLRPSPRFDSRSASLLNSRRTCSNGRRRVWRPAAARRHVERLQARILHLVFAAHLLDEQLRVGANVHARWRVVDGPLQRRQQAVVFRDVVGGDAEAAVQFVERRCRRATRCARHSPPDPGCRGPRRRYTRQSSGIRKAMRPPPGAAAGT